MSPSPQASPYTPDPQFLSLGEGFSDAVGAAAFPQTTLRWRNDRAAAEIGLDGLGDAAWIDHFARFTPLPDNLPQPLALRYHGHQFRTYNPQIGDGRGFLFAQLRDQAGRLMDLGTKGSGTTPYSRQGDGKLTLKGAVRELLATEMLEARGVPTSRTFSIVETGERLWRGDEPSPTRSAVLVRLSWGHVRIGAFQRLHYFGETEATAKLARYALKHFYDIDAEDLSDAETAAQLLGGVIARAADLAAAYMCAGFVHGVLNSDNINVSGESFDYGPWRFAPQWDAGFTAAYFDENGLYAFGRQPGAIHWNCVQLAQALLPLGLSESDAIAALDLYPILYQDAMVRRFFARLGRAPSGEREADIGLVAHGEQALINEAIGIEPFFAAINHDAFKPRTAGGRTFAALLAERPAAAVIPRIGHKPQTMLIDDVEAIWAAIAERDDWQPLHDKLAAIRSEASS